MSQRFLHKLIFAYLFIRKLNVPHIVQKNSVSSYMNSLYNIILHFFNTTMLYFSLFFFFLWRCGPTRAMASSFLRFLDHTQRHTTVGGTPLDEWSARRRDLYLTTHNNHNRQTFMPSVGFEPTIPVLERPQTYALHRAATGTGVF